MAKLKEQNVQSEKLEQFEEFLDEKKEDDNPSQNDESNLLKRVCTTMNICETECEYGQDQ